jgi:quinoprotein glucose dehydrogenase
MPAYSHRLVCSLTVVLSFTGPTFAKADDTPTDKGHPFNPRVMAASADASKALKSFKLASGLSAGLFAAEPLLANPVVFGFDEKGRVYVVETYRLKHGVSDTRGHMNWLDDDLASRTIDDRIAKYKKFLSKKEFESWSVEHDRIKLVEDTDGDGKADRAGVFTDGFHDIATGLAAGVLAHKGEVYFTCIPDLWLLRDTDGDGKADQRKSLAYGFGVHTGFIGHDLHGLKLGPDGKLYFSIGDRGLNVKSVDRSIFLPDTGAVLRCNLDGTEMELFCTGLRNPQEIVFDEYGNLFTVDNNSDSGDRARLAYLIEGGNSGWTMGWQYIERPTSRGPWNAEKLWHPKFEGQAADIVPPLANISDGPSGLAYHPGVARLPEKYKHHFFLADFRGSTSASGVRAFSVKPDGASFKLDQNEQMIWGLLATDVDFGPDGALYVSDWVQGWDTTGKGRIYTFSDSSSADAAAASEVKNLLAEGFDKRSNDELENLLSHADQRVRQGAQFALADRGPAVINLLRGVLGHPGEEPPRSSQLARLHAIWAIGQIARKAPAASEAGLDQLLHNLRGGTVEDRAQVARTLGDVRYEPGIVDLIRTVKEDSNPRVRSLAAISLSKFGKRPEAVKPLLALLRENADKDPFLRHSAVMGLVGSCDLDALKEAAADTSSEVRLGVLLTFRRLKCPDIACFLDDSEERIVTEAARGIYDASIDEALPKLASLVDRSKLSQPAWRRVVNANARVGTPENALALARLANRADVPDAIRIEALGLLAEWPKPSGRDPVTGLWRPRSEHPAKEAADALEKVYRDLLKTPSERVQLAALKAAGPLPMTSESRQIAEIIADRKRSSATRAEALRALDRLSDRWLPDAVAYSLNDAQRAVRIEAQRLLAKLRPDQAIPVLSRILEKGTTPEKQAAFATLGSMRMKEVDTLLGRWLDIRDAGNLPPEVELDLEEAARKRKSDKLTERLRKEESSRPKDDPIAPYREALVGGDAERGERIVMEKAEVQCIRCHKIRGKGGEVGPDLAGVATRQDRRYLLESIVAPNKQIAKGFETLLISTTDGQVRSGILKDETEKELHLITAEGKPLTILKADIEEQKRGVSAMPDDLIKHLGKSELRDVVEYLSTLK